jgi:SAM-dependent methyltransferase
MIHSLGVPLTSGSVDSIEIQNCGLVRVMGWSTDSLPAITLYSDLAEVPLYAHYRTYRPDVRIAHAQTVGEYMGFASEFLLPWKSPPVTAELALLLNGTPIFTGTSEVVEPHYGNLFRTAEVLGRNGIYGVGPPNPDVAPQLLGLAQSLTSPTLDFGCGSGALVRALRQSGHEAHGIELDRQPIRDLLTDDVRAHVTLYDGVFPIPFPDASFNSVFCTEVLEHIPEYRAALAEMARIARKQVILTVPEMTAVPTCFAHNVVPWHLMEGSHVNFFTQRSLQVLLGEYFRKIEFGRILPCSVNGTTYFVSVVAFCEK